MHKEVEQLQLAACEVANHAPPHTITKLLYVLTWGQYLDTGVSARMRFVQTQFCENNALAKSGAASVIGLGQSG